MPFWTFLCVGFVNDSKALGSCLFLTRAMFRRNVKEPPGTMARTKQEPRKASVKESPAQKAANPPTEGASASSLGTSDREGSAKSEASKPQAEAVAAKTLSFGEPGPRKLGQ